MSAPVEQPTQAEMVMWLRAVTRALRSAGHCGYGSNPTLDPFYERFVKPIDDRARKRTELESEALGARDLLCACRKELAGPAAKRRWSSEHFYEERITALESRLVDIDAELEAL